MDRLEYILSVLDCALNTKRKKHLVGEILMSMSLLLGWLAFILILLKEDEDDGI